MTPFLRKMATLAELGSASALALAAIIASLSGYGFISGALYRPAYIVVLACALLTGLLAALRPTHVGPAPNRSSVIGMCLGFCVLGPMELPIFILVILTAAATADAVKWWVGVLGPPRRSLG